MAFRPNPPRQLEPSLWSVLAPGLIDIIDFDSVPSGTMIDQHYTPNGVTFTAPATNTVPSGDVFAGNRSSSAAETPRNTVSISPQGDAFNESQGLIRATFATPKSYVSIDARPVISAMDNTTVPEENKPYIRIYGPVLTPPGGPQLAALLAVVYFPLRVTDANFDSWQSLPYVSPAASPNIMSVVFSCGHTGIGGSVYSFFDHLAFSDHPPSRLFNYAIELG
jgi:hypothetical protein